MDPQQHLTDLFISAGEPSGDLHGAKLIEALLQKRPDLKIDACAGPKMRNFKIRTPFRMEDLSIMGFIDVLLGLPKIILQFYKMRKKILELNPKAVVLIDYPGFHLKLEESLRKKGYKGKLIHFICPTVWAWKKNRIETMEKNLDLLLTIFPFEPKCFAHTKLPVHYIGHPLTESVDKFQPSGKYQGKILALFPGSRSKEIERNLPVQLAVAKELKKLDPSLIIAISATKGSIEAENALFVPREETYELMKSAHLALATSGTVTLELALHKTPTIVTFAITKLDCFLAQKIFKINLPFYCIVNIILEKVVFPELFGPNLTEENLLVLARKLWFEKDARDLCLEGCEEVRKSLGSKPAAHIAAETLFSTVAFNQHCFKIRSIMSAFKILIDRLKGGLTQKIDEGFAPGFLGEDEPELKFRSKVQVKGEIYMTDDHLIIHLKAAATVVMPCAVCNQMIEHNLKVDNFYHTQPIEEISGAVFDYSGALREAILIELPRTVECNGGDCPARASLKPFLRSESRTDKTTYLPFADMDKPIGE